MANIWGEELKIPWSNGIIIKDGEKVGLLFPTGKLLWAIYSEKDNSLTWEDDGHKHQMCDDYLWAIRKWLEY